MVQCSIMWSSVSAELKMLGKQQPVMWGFQYRKVQQMYWNNPESTTVCHTKSSNKPLSNDPCNSRTLGVTFLLHSYLPFFLFLLWDLLAFMGSCWNKIYSSVNNLAIMEKVLVWATDSHVFWWSETAKWVLDPAKQRLLAAMLQFSVSWLHENCGGERDLSSSVL